MDIRSWLSRGLRRRGDWWREPGIRRLDPKFLRVIRVRTIMSTDWATRSERIGV